MLILRRFRRGEPPARDARRQQPRAAEPIFYRTVATVDAVRRWLTIAERADGETVYLNANNVPIAQLRWGDGPETRIGTDGGERWHGWHLEANGFSKVVNVEALADDFATLQLLDADRSAPALAARSAEALRARSHAIALDLAYDDLAAEAAAGTLSLAPIEPSASHSLDDDLQLP